VLTTSALRALEALLPLPVAGANTRCNHLRGRRHRLAAAAHRAVRRPRYAGWRELAVVATHAATIALDPVDNDHTRVTYVRDMTFDDPASAASLAAPFEQEIACLQAYFADHTH
jgi:hypothetical protein